MTPHNKFLEFLDTLDNKHTEVVVESLPADKHWISTIEINGNVSKLLKLDDNYIFIFNDEAMVLNARQYNVVSESFKKVFDFLNK